jgi:high-affinity Fe2+/Pb2+ permease
MQVSICYCIDSYKECSPEAMVTVMLIRNSMSFAAGYGITPWVMDLGLRDTFVIASCVAVAQCLTFVLFLRYGKQLRVRTAQIYGQLAD